jgi:DNA-binding PadR family transcriptional regulator
MVVLALLAEAPMHPYRMQQLIKYRHKDDVVNVAQRNSVYQTIDRLLRAGLITVRETSRAEKRPERTTYEITDEGLTTLRQWLRTMLSTPAREFPEFPAALAFLPLLTADDARRQLETRVTALEEKLAVLDAEVAAATGGERPLPRLFLVEDEYMRAVTEAELKWVRSLVADLRAGRLHWDRRWLRRQAELRE